MDDTGYYIIQGQTNIYVSEELHIPYYFQPPQLKNL